MSKTIVMPTDRGSRITVEINGRKYVYKAGTQYTVPDEVAAAIDESLAEKPKQNQTSVKATDLAGVNAAIAAVDTKANGLNTRLTALDDATNGAVPALDSRLDALDDETDGAVPALGTRVSALDTPETGAIALLDARVTVLEEGT